MGVKSLYWVAALVALHFMAAMALGDRAVTDYFTLTWLREAASYVLVPPILIALGLLVKALREGRKNLIGHVVETFSSQRDRFGYGLILVIGYLLVHRAYRALKVSIPSLNEYWADPMFIRWDQMLFGQDAWRITHSMIGPLGTQFIDMLYVLWLPYMLLAFGFGAFAKDAKFRIRSTASFFVSWIVLGNILAILFASVGPCFYADFYGNDQFEPLMSLLSQQQLAAINLQDYLLSVTDDESIGSGISAVPSLHCAITTLVVLMVYNRYGFGLGLIGAVSYHFAIWIGSVHLGWHYAVDGLISMVLVPPIWWSVGKITDWVENRNQGPQPVELLTA